MPQTVSIEHGQLVIRESGSIDLIGHLFKPSDQLTLVNHENALRELARRGA